jgi:adenosylcobinamide-phosphate synthase
LSGLTAAVIALALLIDQRWGEPPSWAHPVVGIGRYLGLFGQRLCGWPNSLAFLGGAAVWLVGALALGWAARALESGLIAWLQADSSVWRWAVCAVLLGLLLKPLLAWAMLRDEVLAVEAALGRSLEDGRTQLARLVSRDTGQLSAAEVREAAIETLAENLNDSVVAPLFWFALLGLPGAAVYRFANTADAMWGYRGVWEWAGKWAAVADDLLSWLPARLTALALLGWRPGLLCALRQEARRTPSPNSGWPMAAMALRLNVRLAKPGVYTLNAAGVAPTTTHLAAAAKLAASAMWVSAAGLAIVAVVMSVGLRAIA